MCALTTASDVSVFAAGASLYGISDLKRLEEDTHKFESRFPEHLLGGTSAQVPQVYKDRSPVYHADRVISPLLLLQGSIDRVVPKEQAEVIVKRIQEKHGIVHYKECVFVFTYSTYHSN